MSNQFFPFGESPGANPAQVYPYDIIIEEANPGIVLQPTEPNGVVTAFREVGGCSWWALNADYNTDDAQWEQRSPCNAALPAYALEQCSSGTVNRYVAAATSVPGNPISWTLVWSLDVHGNMTVQPQTGTATNQIASTIDVTWNAGSPAVMNVREISLTDTSSNASSLLDNLIVNGTPVWQIRKDGTLVAGSIPFARITGFVFPTNPTFSGTATFTGPAVFEAGMHVTAGTATFDGPVVANDGMTIAGGIGVDNINATGNQHVGGNFQVDGTTTLNNLTATGTVSLPSSAFPVDSIVGAGNVSVTHTGNAYTVDGSALVETVTSSDGAVTLSRSGQTVDIKAGTTAPVIPGSWFVNTEFHNPGIGVTGGGVSLGPLPGTSADTYRVVYRGIAALKDASTSMTVTGTPASGVTWDVSSATYFNGQANAYPFMYFGTAQGGTTPTVTWAASAGEYIFQTPFFATIEAGIQL